jgi:hypothetical protein
MVISPMGLRTMNDCAGDVQQHFTIQTDRQIVGGWSWQFMVLICIFSSRYLALTKRILYVCCIVVVIYIVQISESVTVICSYELQTLNKSNYQSKLHV